MSAFVVSEGTMDRVCNLIVWGRRWGSPMFPVFAGVLTSADDAGDQIGRALYALNWQAVNARYGADVVAEHWSDEPVRSYRHRGAWGFPPDDAGRFRRKVDALKAMHCLHYQCSEGSAVETEAYRDLAAAIDQVTQELVSLLPEYEAAGWDTHREDARWRVGA